MLTHPTLDKLKTLKFSGMANALEEQWNMAEFKDMTFEERLGLLIDREMTERDNRKLTSRLRRARLKHLSVRSRNVSGSVTNSISSSPGPPASVKPGSPVRSPRKPAVKATPLSISDCPGSCRT
jgi:hypothetical protein